MSENVLGEALRHKSAMQQLIATEGWEVLNKVLAEREDVLLQEMLQPDVTNDELRDSRGMLRNTKMIRELPSVIIEQAEMVIERESEEEDDE